MKQAKKDKIIRKHVGEDPIGVWTVYRSLVAEIELDGCVYQLVNNDWFEISSSFVEEIGITLSNINTSTIKFPSHSFGEVEKDYNIRAARHLRSLLMDCQLISLGGGRNKIEFCDILQDDGTLIHAKKRGASSTLSHLWSQGTVSMEALLGDEDFRARVRSKIEELDPNYAATISTTPKGTDFTVVYLIIGIEEGDDAWKSLPFFSQVALVQAMRTLNTMGVGIEFAGVASQ